MVALLVLAWRLWPAVPIFTGLNLRASKDFELFEELSLPAKEPKEIYGGLEHPYFEAYKLTIQLLFFPRLMSHGHAFDSSSLHNWTSEEVARILSEPGAIRPWGGNKMCGGFHADYLIRWEKRGEPLDLIYCSGCDEVIIYHKGKSLRADLSYETCRQLNNLLYPRPEKKKTAKNPSNPKLRNSDPGHLKNLPREDASK